MAERGKEPEQEEPTPLVELTTEIVAAYVTRNAVAMDDLGNLIGIVGRELRMLGREEARPAPVKPKPAVPVRRSIQDDHLVCPLCGRRQKTLRRHLEVSHRLTPEAYRELFGLKSDYPMSAPSYSRQRSETAQRLGLGRRREPPPRRRRRKEQG